MKEKQECLKTNLVLIYTSIYKQIGNAIFTTVYFLDKRGIRLKEIPLITQYFKLINAFYIGENSEGTSIFRPTYHKKWVMHNYIFIL